MKRRVIAEALVAVVCFGAGMVAGNRLADSGGDQQELAPTSDTPTSDTWVSGIGGVFFKAQDPDRLRTWYREHLGIDAGELGVNFFWRDELDQGRFGRTVWAIFPQATTYFGNEGRDLMINYRVHNLNALLAKLQAQGVQPIGRVEEFWYGRFAWIVDGEGNRLELWEPVDYTPEEFERRLRNEVQ